MTTDWRSMFDRDYLGHWDLDGREVTVTIAKVAAATLTSQGNRKTKKPVIYFEGKEKGLACNKTNGKIIAQLYGNDTEKWAGKQITLYPTTTTFGIETVDCIRVRPPAKSQRRQREPNGPTTTIDPSPEPGSNG